MYIVRAAVCAASASDSGKKGCASNEPSLRVPLRSVRKPTLAVAWYDFSAVWKRRRPPSLFSMPKVAMPWPRFT